jgi:hypothetical protein
MIPQELSGGAEVSVQVTVDTPLPIFVQVLIPMGLGLTIFASCKRRICEHVRWRGQNSGRPVRSGQRRFAQA